MADPKKVWALVKYEGGGTGFPTSRTIVAKNFSALPQDCTRYQCACEILNFSRNQHSARFQAELVDYNET